MHWRGDLWSSCRLVKFVNVCRQYVKHSMEMILFIFTITWRRKYYLHALYSICRGTNSGSSSKMLSNFSKNPKLISEKPRIEFYTGFSSLCMIKMNVHFILRVYVYALCFLILCLVVKRLLGNRVEDLFRSSVWNMFAYLGFGHDCSLSFLTLLEMFFLYHSQPSVRILLESS